MAQRALELQREAKLHFQRKNYTVALQLLTEAIQHDPTDYALFVDKAEVRFHQHAYVDCIIEAEHALNLREDLYKAMCFIIESHTLLGRLTEAADMCKQAELVFPSLILFIEEYRKVIQEKKEIMQVSLEEKLNQCTTKSELDQVGVDESYEFWRLARDSSFNNWLDNKYAKNRDLIDHVMPCTHGDCRMLSETELDENVHNMLQEFDSPDSHDTASILNVMHRFLRWDRFLHTITRYEIATTLRRIFLVCENEESKHDALFALRILAFKKDQHHNIASTAVFKALTSELVAAAQAPGWKLQILEASLCTLNELYFNQHQFFDLVLGDVIGYASELLSKGRGAKNEMVVMCEETSIRVISNVISSTSGVEQDELVKKLNSSQCLGYMILLATTKHVLKDPNEGPLCYCVLTNLYHIITWCTRVNPLHSIEQGVHLLVFALKSDFYAVRELIAEVLYYCISTRDPNVIQYLLDKEYSETLLLDLSMKNCLAIPEVKDEEPKYLSSRTRFHLAALYALCKYAVKESSPMLMLFGRIANEILPIIDHFSDRVSEDKDAFKLSECEVPSLIDALSLMALLCKDKIIALSMLEKDIVRDLLVILKPAFEKNPFMAHWVTLPLLPLLNLHPSKTLTELSISSELWLSNYKWLSANAQRHSKQEPWTGVKKTLAKYEEKKMLKQRGKLTDIPKCAFCKKVNATKRCAKCQEAYYCDRNCQAKHYPEHYVLCCGQQT
jgi:tetratricopeptide (TPR) repeat protein